MDRNRLSLPTLLLLAFASVDASAFDPFIVPDINVGKIVGTWTLRIGTMRHTIAFAKDGTFRGTYQVGEKMADEYEGTWKIESPYIGNPVLHYTYNKSKLIAPGTKDSDVIEILNDKALWVITKNGTNDARRIWTRVKDAK